MLDTEALTRVAVVMLVLNVLVFAWIWGKPMPAYDDIPGLTPVDEVP